MKFREKLEEYLLCLEAEFKAPERYRVRVMEIFDKTEKYGLREVTDEDFERIKIIARCAYANAIETSESLSRSKKSLDIISSRLSDASDELRSKLQGLGKSLEELERGRSQIQKTIPKLEDQLNVFDALKKAKKNPNGIN